MKTIETSELVAVSGGIAWPGSSGGVFSRLPADLPNARQSLDRSRGSDPGIFQVPQAPKFKDPGFEQLPQPPLKWNGKPLIAV